MGINKLYKNSCVDIDTKDITKPETSKPVAKESKTAKEESKQEAKFKEITESNE